MSRKPNPRPGHPRREQANKKILDLHLKTLQDGGPDTELIYKKVISDIARRHGKEYTKEVRMKVLGTLESVTARIIVEELDLPMTPDQFQEAVKEKVMTEFPKANLFPGVEKLLLHLDRHGVPMALATSASEVATERKAKMYLHLFNLFGHKVMGSSDPEVKMGKPHPDIFLVCAGRFPDKPKPEQCLVFEDAPNGVQAALAAGMQVVIVPGKETPRELCQPATQVLDSLEEFQPELYGLPPYPKT